MRITIKTKNLELPVILKKFIEDKVIVLKRFINILKEDVPGGRKTLAEVLVEIERETIHHKKGEVFEGRIEINLPGKRLIAKFKGEDLQKVIVGAREQIKKEIKKYKFKRIDKNRRQQRKVKKELSF